MIHIQIKLKTVKVEQSRRSHVFGQHHRRKPLAAGAGYVTKFRSGVMLATRAYSCLDRDSNSGSYFRHARLTVQPPDGSLACSLRAAFVSVPAGAWSVSGNAWSQHRVSRPQGGPCSDLVDHSVWMSVCARLDGLANALICRSDFPIES